jgi:hypothetical protein
MKVSSSLWQRDDHAKGHVQSVFISVRGRVTSSMVPALIPSRWKDDDGYTVSLRDGAITVTDLIDTTTSMSSVCRATKRHSSYKTQDFPTNTNHLYQTESLRARTTQMA